MFLTLQSRVRPSPPLRLRSNAGLHRCGPACWKIFLHFYSGYFSLLETVYSRAAGRLETDASARNVFLQIEREPDWGSRDRTTLTSREPASHSATLPAFHEIFISRDEILWKCSCRRPLSLPPSLIAARPSPSLGLCSLQAAVCRTTAGLHHGRWWMVARLLQPCSVATTSPMWRSRDNNCRMSCQTGKCIAQYCLACQPDLRLILRRKNIRNRNEGGSQLHLVWSTRPAS